MLDVAFGEDASRVRQGNAAGNLSVLRRMALNMLKQETTSQGGVAAKRKRVGWDEDYLPWCSLSKIRASNKTIETGIESI